MPSDVTLIDVAVPVGVTGTFTYSVPLNLRSSVEVGSRVLVPWGTKVTTGFVVSFADASVLPHGKIKPIREVLDDGPAALVRQVLELCIWAADYYIAPVGEMLKVALPANMASRGKTNVALVMSEEELRSHLKQMTKKQLEVVGVLQDGGGSAPMSAFSANRDALKKLIDAGVVATSESHRDRVGVRYDRFIILESPPPLLPTKQQAVIDLLTAAGGEASYADLIANGASGASISTLTRKGVVRVERRPRSHSMSSFVTAIHGETTFQHTPEQRNAIDRVTKAFGAFRPFLLQGVTGSGKTEVYIELLRRCMKRGEKAIVLVPEIGLTPAFASRLTREFGDRVAILHSSLSAGEKYDQWRRAREGEVDIAIGPRSALFSPFETVGLIIVDEEGDAAYKQEETPRYNARDLAVVRARLAAAPVVLGSATPSLESRNNAEEGKYELIRLTKRVEERPLPEVEVVDLRRERGEKEDRGLVIFSTPMVEQLRATFEQGEQAIILMNRRGYAPYLLCRECENDFRCRDCSVTLTVHRRAGLLICHYCGFRRPLPKACPNCSGEVLQPIGFGTEKVEERFRRLFPDVPVAVLDRDSTRRKGELVRILDDFRHGKSKALIGTQMISKGHDFPNVTLTCVINADSVLGYPDFRSAEKTFYLLTQVAGRSGRGELRGKVLIQSAFPNHYAIQHAARHDYDEFYRSEIEFRDRFHYPPFSSMISIIFRGENFDEVDRASDEGGKRLDEEVKGMEDVRIQGPAAAPLARIKAVYRFQILARSRQRAALRRAVERAFLGKSFRGTDVVIDVDPLNIL